MSRIQVTLHTSHPPPHTLAPPTSHLAPPTSHLQSFCKRLYHPPANHQLLHAKLQARPPVDTPGITCQPTPGLILRLPHVLQFVSDVRVSPGTADNLRDLPPTVVMVCELDPLRDAGIKYFQRLQACGCRSALVQCPSVHGAFTLQDILPEARQAFDECLLQLHELLKGV
jgi:acetyl esterase/lipase